MSNEHWIIYRAQPDSQVIHILGVCHGPMEAQATLENAACEEARQANMLRETLFANGQSCGRAKVAEDFAYHYVTTHVKGTS